VPTTQGAPDGPIAMVIESSEPYHPGGEPANVVDGDLNTFWNPNTVRYFNQWYITFELDQRYTVDGLKLRNYGDTTHDTTDFFLEASDDQVTWQMAGRGTGVAPGYRDWQSFGHLLATGKYLRFTVTNTETGWQPYINEITFTGYPAPPTTLPPPPPTTLPPPPPTTLPPAPTTQAVPENRLLPSIKIRTEHIQWKQGSFFGIGGSKKQDYTLILSRGPGTEEEFIYVQDGYPLDGLINVCDLQYGSYDLDNGRKGVFFVYHDKSQKPYQKRFGLKANGIDQTILDAIDESIDSATFPGTSSSSSFWDFNWLFGDNLKDVDC